MVVDRKTGAGPTMIAVLDTSEDLAICAAELGCPVEQLFSPLTRFSDKNPGASKAMDNGGFAGLDIAAFQSLLERENHQRDLFRFVTAPDIVASARRTLELFEYWYPLLCGWPLALVAQDGQENLPIPWNLIAAVFIGGSTNWKLSKHAADIIKTGRGMGKWVHVGRVNDPVRWQYFKDLGADSVDGTGIARYSHMRIAIRDREVSAQSKLFTPETDAERPQERFPVWSDEPEHE